METIEKIKTLTEELSVDTTKFFKGNNSAGKLAQDLKNLLQQLRTEILEERKKEENV